jgi:hypothetical protein
MASNNSRVDRRKTSDKQGSRKIDRVTQKDDPAARKTLGRRRGDLVWRLADAPEGAVSEIEEVLARYGL